MVSAPGVRTRLIKLTPPQKPIRDPSVPLHFEQDVPVCCAGKSGEGSRRNRRRKHCDGPPDREVRMSDRKVHDRWKEIEYRSAKRRGTLRQELPRPTEKVSDLL